MQYKNFEKITFVYFYIKIELNWKILMLRIFSCVSLVTYLDYRWNEVQGGVLGCNNIPKIYIQIYSFLNLKSLTQISETGELEKL